MGSSESTLRPSEKERERQAQARLRAREAILAGQKAQLEMEKQQWQEQLTRERHWKEQQQREEEKRKEAAREWQRQAELREIKLQQEKMQKELEEQKAQREVQRQVEKKLLKQLEEQRLQQEQLLSSKTLSIFTNNQPRTQQVIVPCAVSPAPPRPRATFAMRETVAVQQRAATFQRSAEPELPEEQRLLLDKVRNLRLRNQQTRVTDSPTTSSPTSPKSYVMRMKDANAMWAEWSVVDWVREKNSITPEIAASVVRLLEDGNTVPFIARYGRHLTEGMDEERLRGIRDSYKLAKATKQRAIGIVRDIDAKGQWTPEFHTLVHVTKSLDDLEHIYAVFKSAKSAVSKRAADLGLEIVAEACMKKKAIPIARLVQESVEGLKTVQEVTDGISCLMADTIIRDSRTFDLIRKLRTECAMSIETAKGKEADKLEKSENKYKSYYNFTSLASDLKPHQVFAINKGKALKALTVKINIPEEFARKFKERCMQQYGFTETSVNVNLLEAAIDVAMNRSIKGAISKRTLKEINDRAQNAAVWGPDGLAQNIKRHLLEPPVRGRVVIGISPGFKHDCKFAVVSEKGDVLDTGTIYPNDEKNPNGKGQAKRTLVRLLGKHSCTTIALGDGVASKETETFLTSMMKDRNVSPNVFYTIVDESGAKIYSCSRAAALEFPGVAAKIVSAVSVARRLQDPMAELVKIEPELLTSDVYRQDVSNEQIAAELTEIIVETVSYVGVDANMASLALLRRVAGLNDVIANSIVERILAFGPFAKRNDLLKVKGMSERIFKQCAGFIRIVPETAEPVDGQKVPRDYFNYLDQTRIHPKYYSIAEDLIEAARCDAHQVGTSSFVFAINLYAQTNRAILARKFGTTAETFETIVHDLKIKKGQDVRGEEDTAKFRRSVIKFDDLNHGDLLIGLVTNVESFGAFVEVGAEKDGFIHTSCMNGMCIEVGKKVEVKVIKVDRVRGRLGVTFVKFV